MRALWASVLLLTGVVACAERRVEAPLPYRLGQALVIGDTKGGTSTSIDDACATPQCDAVIERCGGEAAADVVLDQDGTVADVLCYRPNVHVEEIGVDNVETALAGNNTVLVFDAEDDGADVTGDVLLAGNNVIVYGAGADVSVIGGDLNIDKNNAIVRGITIQGDVHISKNNAQLAFVTIHGNLIIDANNTTLAESVVFGQVEISGNNTVLVQNQLQVAPPVTGKNLTCNGNVRIEDLDADGVVDSEELGAELGCSEPLP
jgi:hypothetical protein